MSDIIACPDCDTKLKPKVPLPPGKKVRCPKCSTLFAPVAEAPKKPTKSLAAKEQVDTSVSKGRRASVAEREEEEDERPRRRPSSTVEEEDSEEIEADELPRRSRKKRPRKRGNMRLLLGLGIGGVMLFLLLLVAGVVIAVVMGRKDPYKETEAGAKEIAACMDELAVTMEGVRDRETAKTAAVRIHKICDRMDNVIGRMEKLPKLTPPQNERLKNELTPQISAVTQRLARASFQAGAASQREPTFMAVLPRLQQVSNRLRQLD